MEHETQIVLKTPIHKELLIFILCLLFTGMGAVLFYIGYTDMDYVFLGLGAVIVAVTLPGALIEVSSRDVLTANIDGISLKPHAYAKMRTYRWSEIDGFEVFEQTHRGSKQRYLAIRLAALLDSNSPKVQMLRVLNGGKEVTPQERVWVSEMKLPGSAKENVERLEALKARLAA